MRPNGRAPHSCVRQAVSSGKGALLGGHLPACESHFSPFHLDRGREVRGTHPRPSPDQCRAQLQLSSRLGGRRAQRRGSPLSLDPSDSHSRAYLSWRCTHKTTQLRSHPSASLPRVPAEPGARKPGGNKCASIPRRAGLAAAKLASGRRGRWLGGTGCCALGSRPGRRPRPPRPQPVPQSGRRHPARTPAPAAAALFSELERERGARPLRQVALGAGSGFPSAAKTRADGAAAATTQSTGAGVPGPAGKREELEAEAPLRLHALQPRRAGLATTAVSASAPCWRLQKLP